MNKPTEISLSSRNLICCHVRNTCNKELIKGIVSDNTFVENYQFGSSIQQLS
jgi:hypothetical protein